MCLLSQSRSLVWLREGETINHSSFPKLWSTLQKVKLDSTSGSSKVGMRLLLLAKCLEGLGGGCVCIPTRALRSPDQAQTRRSQKHTTTFTQPKGEGDRSEGMKGDLTFGCHPGYLSPHSCCRVHLLHFTHVHCVASSCYREAHTPSSSCPTATAGVGGL